ncbi:VPLPA-CTERM sorting domain-containing protein [Pseudooceanicola sp.]
MRFLTFAATAALGFLAASQAQATLVSLGDCTGGISCTITSTPPNPVSQNPNDRTLLAWNEKQNFVLTERLRVDRVFDTNASFVSSAGGGDYFLEVGTIVSSHYIQWDNDGSGSDRIQTTIGLDSQIFAFITADQNLFDSDYLGLPGLDYADFNLRGLENSDTTIFNGSDVDIDWTASSPGDWTRLITAYSPSAEVPVPAALPLLLGAFGALGAMRRRRRT